MQALAFPRGNIYQIICQQTGQALRVQGNDPNSFKDSRIISVGINPNDLGQLFMVEKVGLQDDNYEIVNCLANLVFDEEGGEIRLQKGKQNSDQLFFVDKAPVQGNTYWLKTSIDGKRALAMEGILRYKSFDPNAPNQLFAINLVNNCGALNETSVLINANSGKALDIPYGTFDHGERLIQWEKNKRFNQRWRWVKSGNGYMIMSLLTGQCVDIAGEKTESGSKVVQWDRTGGSNQLWAVQQVGNGLFRIKSLHAPGKYLGVKNGEVDDGGKIEINDDDNPSLVWRIQGYQPN